ncbi:KAP family P-loop NTPase fold protein [Rhodanobacter soli]
MWTDNETDRDLLNFTGVAQSIAELVIQAGGKPISIGVSGAWGIGKSSMMKLTETALRGREAKGGPAFVFVEFNAWLYQGFDDARAALMDVIATKLQEVAEDRKTFQDKARELLARVNWYRVGRVTANAAISVASGMHPAGLIGSVMNIAKSAMGKTDEGEKGNDKWLKNKPDETPPQEIQALRDGFVDLLRELGVTLIVLIDDLDRCLPETTISTLEAIRLFLFMEHSAFVIAADQAMIKYAVKRHFQDVDDPVLVTSYFDKLIQVPIRVPALGLQEVRAYLMMLFVDGSEIDPKAKDHIRDAIAKQLRESWQGKRVDRNFVIGLVDKMPSELVTRLDLAERIAPIMSDPVMTSGNPRLIKRFLNALSIRMALGKAQGVDVKEEVLAKLLIFERADNSKAYGELTSSVADNDAGKPTLLKDWESSLANGKDIDPPAPWDGEFMKLWLALAPPLAEEDLRGALYVSREHAPLVSRDDRLSAEAVELIEAVLGQPAMAERLQDRLKALPRIELSVVMDRVLERCRGEAAWGAPPILKAALTVSRVDEQQAMRFAAFLHDRPVQILKPAIAMSIKDEPWARDVLEHWLPQVKGPMKVAIEGALR